MLWCVEHSRRFSNRAALKIEWKNAAPKRICKYFGSICFYMITRMKESTHFLMLNLRLMAIEVSLCGFTMHTVPEMSWRNFVSIQSSLQEKNLGTRIHCKYMAIWFIIFKIKLWILWSAAIAQVALVQISTNVWENRRTSFMCIWLHHFHSFLPAFDAKGSCAQWPRSYDWRTRAHGTHMLWLRKIKSENSVGRQQVK